MGADGGRRARAGLGGPDGPTSGRGANPPGEAYSRSAAAGRRRRRRRFMSAAAGGRPRGGDAGKHFPTSPPTFPDLHLGSSASVWAPGPASFCGLPPFPTCPCA